MDKNIFINPKLTSFVNPTTRFNIAYGGRASSKSWNIADILVLKSLSEKEKLILCVKGTMRSISDSVKSLIEMTIQRHGFEEFFYITDKEIVCLPTKSRFIFYGLQHPDRLKSLEGVDYCWIEEASVDVTDDALDVLFPTIRKPGSKIYITFNPKKDVDAVWKKFIKENQPDTTIVKLNYYDNPFLSQEMMDYIENIKQTNIKKYLHYFEGELMQADEGALWSDNMFDYIPEDEGARFILSDFEEMEEIVVAIDPSITSKITSDECGIIVAGRYKKRDEYIIIEDLSRISSPDEWINIAIAAYDMYKANKIIAEENQGGDMIKTLLRNKRSNIPYTGVRATRGKILRAEPIAALYEQGKVRHLKRFPNLEYEMLTYTGRDNEKSPNHLDAAVWALTHLSSKRFQSPAGLVLASNSLDI